VLSRKRAAAPRTAGIATWYRRSIMRSELRATIIIATSPVMLGIITNSPTKLLE